MKKVFKALSILVAATALSAGIAVAATGCSSGYDGKYTGTYSYNSQYGQVYGMAVEVTVKDNIITGVKDITNTEEGLKLQGGYTSAGWGQPYKYTASGVEWHSVSDGWSKYFKSSASRLLYTAEEANISGAAAGDLFYKVTKKESGVETTEYIKWDGKSVVEYDYTKGGYGWTDSNEASWTNHVSWLTQKYVGWSVADVLDLTVYTNYGYTPDANGALVADTSVSGEPYETSYNDELNSSGLLITGATQGSGRLLLAVQDALSK